MKSPWAHAASLACPPSERWRTDPVLWAKERIDTNLWSKQRDIANSLVVNPNTVVYSCHNVGKSFIAAVAACWWLDVHPPGSAFVVTTAPTGVQVKAILWREINRLHARGQLPGRTNLTEWYIGGEIVALGRKPNDYEPTAFQGIHAPYVLVIYDEGCGIPDTLYEAGSSMTSNEGSRQLAIGNPDIANGLFHRMCTGTGGWFPIHVGYQDAPNFTGEPVDAVVSQSTISPGWVAEKRETWGEASPLFMSKCLGVFPVDADDGVIPSSTLMSCANLELPESEPHEAGLDFGASSGGDQTVLRERRGPRVGRVKRWREADAMKLIGEIAETLSEWDIGKVKCDSNGVGWGVTARLRELSSKHNVAGECSHDAEVIGVNTAERANEPKRFINQRAELWWMGRELSRLKQWDTSELDEDSIADLIAPRYTIVDSTGKIKVEAKKDIHKRLGRSPDDADALLLAYYEVNTIATGAVAGILDARLPGVMVR